MKQESGFTLVELMVTVSVVAILLALAVPGFQSFLVGNNLASSSASFLSTVNYARSEAVKRSMTVTICPSADGATCTGTWSNGWITFVDTNANGSANAGETVLRAHPALTSSYSAASTLQDSSGNSVSYISYARNGLANDTGTVAICYQNDTSQSQAITITLTRPRIAPDTNGDGIPNKESGSNITSCANP